MKRSNIFGVAAAVAVVSVSAFASTAARADSLQNDKNNARNLAIAGGIAAIYGVTHGNSTATIIGAGVAAVAGSQYEKDRQQQNANNGYYGWDNGGRYRHNGDDRNYHSDQGYTWRTDGDRHDGDRHDAGNWDQGGNWNHDGDHHDGDRHDGDRHDSGNWNQGGNWNHGAGRHDGDRHDDHGGNQNHDGDRHDGDDRDGDHSGDNGGGNYNGNAGGNGGGHYNHGNH